MEAHDRRAHPRQPCLLKVQVEIGRDRLEGTAINLSESGAFIASPLAVPFGSDATLRFRRPSDKRWIVIGARVVRVVRPGDPVERQVGFAVRFRGLLSQAAPADGPGTPSPRPPESGVPPRPPGPAAGAPRPVGGGTQPDPGPPRPTLRERTLRVFRSLPVRFQEKGRPGRVHSAELENLSMSGLYLKTERLPLVGSVVFVEFDGTDVDGLREPLRLSGQVRWWGSQRPEAGLAKGFGMQILAFGGVADQVRYERFVMRLLVEGGATLAPTNGH